MLKNKLFQMLFPMLAMSYVTEADGGGAVATPEVKPATTGFHFKSTTEIKVAPIGVDEAGQPVFGDDGKALLAAGYKYDAKKGWKRPSVEAVLPTLGEEDIVNILAQGGQGKQFLLAICDEQFYDFARSKINELLTENAMATITAGTVASFGMSWEAMAASYLEAAASARATGIPKEVWDEFMLDYQNVMTRELASAPGMNEEKIKNAAEHLKLRFAKCRSNKKMLSKLRDYLGLWYTATSRADEFAKLFVNLDDRAKTLLAADDEDSI